MTQRNKMTRNEQPIKVDPTEGFPKNFEPIYAETVRAKWIKSKDATYTALFMVGFALLGLSIFIGIILVATEMILNTATPDEIKKIVSTAILSTFMFSLGLMSISTVQSDFYNNGYKHETFRDKIESFKIWANERYGMELTPSQAKNMLTQDNPSLTANDGLSLIEKNDRCYIMHWNGTEYPMKENIIKSVV